MSILTNLLGQRNMWYSCHNVKLSSGKFLMHIVNTVISPCIGQIQYRNQTPASAMKYRNASTDVEIHSTKVSRSAQIRL